jgi:hypothetical protein
MADEYWDHPARREIKRLIDLGDANLILNDLQNRETEWDDAREALDHLVRGANAGPEETPAATAGDPMTRAKLSELLGDMECGVGPDSGDIMNACDDLVAQARAEERAKVRQLADRLRALPTVYMDGVTAVPVGELHRVLDEAVQDGGRTDD